MKKDRDVMEKINRDMKARKAACKILEVTEGIDKERLKEAYRLAAIKHHPDHNDNRPEANKKFTLIKCAYELLAFNRPCEDLLEEINSWPGMPQDSEYRTDNPWGHFLWWREKFFGSEPRRREKTNRRNSCI